MGIAAWLDLEAKDVVAFLMSVIFGYIAAAFLPLGPWSDYAPLLISYHVFLLWLLFARNQKLGSPWPLLYTLLTHSACIAVVVSLGMSEIQQPYFRFLRLGLAALASFECSWLFKADEKIPREDTSIGNPAPVGNAEDFQQWLLYIEKNKLLSRMRADSLRAEYHQWLLARTSSRTAATSGEMAAGD